MHDPNEPTRRALLRAAEKLFAARAAGEVSAVDIAREAGLNDERAVADCFGDRIGVLRAIIDGHQVPIDARRNRLLDDCLRDGRPDARAAAEVIVFPLVDKLTDPHGGREYLMICARLRRDPDHFEMLLSGSTGISRALEFLLPEDAPTDDRAFHRLEIISTMVVHGLADIAQDGRDDHGLYIRTLIDSICAVVANVDRAPLEPSPEVTTPVSAP